MSRTALERLQRTTRRSTLFCETRSYTVPMKRLTPALLIGAIVALFALRRRNTRPEADLTWQPVDPR